MMLLLSLSFYNYKYVTHLLSISMMNAEVCILLSAIYLKHDRLRKAELVRGAVVGWEVRCIRDMAISQPAIMKA